MFTAEQTLTALQEVVAELGRDYVYPTDDCRYADGRDPSCIVGRVIHKLDPELFAKIAAYENGRLSCALEILKQAETNLPAAEAEQHYYYPPTDLAGWAELGITGHFDDLGYNILLVAQREQDAMFPYGKALDRAERVYAGEPV